MPRPKPKRTLTDYELMQRLNAELFSLVEGDQGEAHVSDEHYADSLSQFFAFAEAQLFYSRQASKKMASFIRKHKRRLRHRLGHEQQPDQ